jgi:hypothetical protein
MSDNDPYVLLEVGIRALLEALGPDHPHMRGLKHLNKREKTVIILFQKGEINQKRGGIMPVSSYHTKQPDEAHLKELFNVLWEKEVVPRAIASNSTWYIAV